MSSFSVAMASLGRMRSTLERLSDVPARTAALAAPRINALIQAGFDAGTDPYGTAWKPLRPATLAKGRFPPPLTATGRMRSGTKVRPRAGGRAGLVLVVGASYARFHQTGTRYMAARRIAPTRGMPASWRREIVAASKEAGQSALLSYRGIV